MNDGITIRLAGIPQGKGRPRFSRANGRAYTPAKTAHFEAALRYAAQEVMAGRPPYVCPVEVLIVANLPVPASWSQKKQAQAISGELLPAKKPDWDNLAKVCDALNEVVWRDDAQIVDGRVRKKYSEQPSLVVYVRPVVGEAA